ncbi:MAG: helix-turn-helix domain-containing protein [Pseudomonadota bacterium]
MDLEPLLTTAEAAPVIGVSAGTLENWRVNGYGPRFIKSGRRVVYDPTDIEAWKNENRFQSTSEANQPVTSTFGEDHLLKSKSAQKTKGNTSPHCFYVRNKTEQQ